MASVGNVKTFAVAPNGDSAPDSITTANGTFFVEYGNNADSTGAGGSSTIIQYDNAGNIEHTYTIAGCRYSATLSLRSRRRQAKVAAAMSSPMRMARTRFWPSRTATADRSIRMVPAFGPAPLPSLNFGLAREERELPAAQAAHDPRNR